MALLEIPCEGPRHPADPAADVEQAPVSVGVPDRPSERDHAGGFSLTGAQELVEPPSSVAATGMGQDGPVGIEPAQLVPVALVLSQLALRGHGRL